MFVYIDISLLWFCVKFNNMKPLSPLINKILTRKQYSQNHVITNWELSFISKVFVLTPSSRLALFIFFKLHLVFTLSASLKVFFLMFTTLSDTPNRVHALSVIGRVLYWPTLSAVYK